MSQMNINITNIFTTPDKFGTVKNIILMIEIFIFAPKRIKVFMKLFFRWVRKQGLDKSIHLIPIISVWIFEDILPNVIDYAQHPTSHSIISINISLSFNPQLWYYNTEIFWIIGIIIWWRLFFISFIIRHVPYIICWIYV